MTSRRYLPLALVALAACAAVVVFLLAGKPGGREGESRSGETPPEAQEEPRPPEAQAECSGPGETAGGGGTFTVVPGTGEGGPAMIINFPDPLSWGEAAPGEEMPGVCGRWVLEMEGAPFALKNCHLLLDERGNLALPPDYGSVLEMREGFYTWDVSSGSFQAHADLVVKAGSGAGQAEVPLRISLEGRTTSSLLEITGSYLAIPGGEVYTPYTQQGGFIMRRHPVGAP